MNAIAATTADAATPIPALLTPVTPMAMLSTALSNGTSVEVLTQLMGLAERWEATQARKAFDAAVAAAKAEIPVVGKNREGHNSKRYADFAAFARVVDPVLAKHGLYYRFRTTQEATIRVACVLSHSAGHSEENSLAAGADTSGNKNAIQAIGSTLTYLQRYTLIQALGLAASEDDDGASAAVASETITDEQMKKLQSEIDAAGVPVEKVCEYAKVDSLSAILAKHFDQVVTAVRSRRKASS